MADRVERSVEFEAGREFALRTLATALRKVLSPELVALVEAEVRRGLAAEHSVCGNWTPQKDGSHGVQR